MLNYRALFAWMFGQETWTTDDALQTAAEVSINRDHQIAVETHSWLKPGLVAARFWSAHHSNPMTWPVAPQYQRRMGMPLRLSRLIIAGNLIAL